jgi:hypothetical protein
MNNKITREITLSGLFIALGLILPQFFHIFGENSGTVFSPMHIPVFIAGFTLSLPYAAAVGILIPVLSTIFTTMPPLFPVLPFMIFELATYAVITNVLYRKARWNVYVSLVSAMVAGRIVSAAVVWVLASFFAAQLPNPVAFVTGGVTQGIIGIILQLVIIPPIIMLLSKNNLIKRESIKIKV